MAGSARPARDQGTKKAGHLACLFVESGKGEFTVPKVVDAVKRVIG